MEINTERTLLVKYDESDFESFCNVICNDEVMYHISGKGYSPKVAKEKFEGILKTNKENDIFGCYKVLFKEDRSVIGFAKLVPFETDMMEIGYALMPKFWRMGLTTEMIQQLVSTGKRYFNDKRIIAIVNVDNIGSLKVLERFNFVTYKTESFKGDLCHFLESKT
jgi:ribosomal-protein-alanine N-acetyltransferase